jgi:PDZ domain-containing protein
VRIFTPFRLLLLALVVGAAAFAVWAIPTDDYIFLPNRAHAVAPLVDVEGGHNPRDGGGIYFVDVLVRKATLVERVWPDVREGATVVPAEAVRPPGVSEAERRRGELEEMRQSQQVAAAVALQELGYKVVARPVGARIEFVDPTAPAEGVLKPGDIVVRALGQRVRVPGELRRLVSAQRVGAEIPLTVRREGELVPLRVRTMRGTEGRAIIGVIVSQEANIRFPPSAPEVDIDVRGVGGPSAGLAFALDVLEELGRDVDHGNRVAVTGTIELDGSVGEIGGVKQKTIGVRRAGIRVFVVPAGENAREARRHAGNVRVVAVENFQQALRALATLPRNAQD